MPDLAPQSATAARLYAAARYHARAALDLAQAPWDAHKALDIATRAGSVVELLAKALLVHHDERLVTYRDAHQHLLDIVLHKAGKPAPSAFRPNKQTVDARVAVELVQRLGPDIDRHGRVAKNVLSARNDAVHMAVPRDRADLEVMITQMSDFANAILMALKLEVHDFWGGHTSAVRQRVDEHHAEVLLDARAAVAAAQRAYEDLRSSIGPEAWPAVLLALQQRVPQYTASELSAEVACPACTNPANISWSTEVEVDVDHGETIYYPYYVLDGLLCPVCSLHLNSDQVESLELEDMPDLGEIASAYEERESERLYELWQSQ
ncbi:hypothetical protein [Promicromonospora sp. NFX87]|uniref:hypothetical protein n=1 Tax=Promicromonospora sp. NFX87 TaxID=3402691 RepID=UPI003AFB1187